MQRIERYGVIALVFLLVTIVAVSLWGEQRKTGGLFHFLRRDSKSAQVDRLVAEAPQSELPAWQEPETRTFDSRNLPLAPEPDGKPLSPAENPPGPVVPSPIAKAEPQIDDSPYKPEQAPLAGEIVFTPAPPSDPLIPAQSAPAKPATYTIQKGDTLGQIAQRELGTVRRLPELLEANPKLDPRKIQPGQVIRLPVAGGEPPIEVAQSEPQAPSIADRKLAEPPPKPKLPQQQAATGRAYTVRAGDTLGQIATRELGTVKRMSEILALNKGLDPDRLIPGRTLVLPAGAPPERSLQVAKADTQPQAQLQTKPEAGSVQGTPARSKVR